MVKTLEIFENFWSYIDLIDVLILSAWHRGRDDDGFGRGRRGRRRGLVPTLMDQAEEEEKKERRGGGLQDWVEEDLRDEKKEKS